MALSTLYEQEVTARYPGLKEYKACQSRAFMKGLAGVIGGAGVGFFGARVLQQYMTLFPAKYNVVFATGVSLLFGYTASAHATAKCQRLFTEAEWARQAQESRQNRLNDEEYVKSLSDSETSVYKDEVVNKTKYGDQME